MSDKTILLVDDATIIRIMLKKILEGAGYNVVGEAANGQEAIDKYKELKPGLVILDITMPEKNGIEAAREIRAFDGSATIIMCSAMGQQSYVIEAIQAGARDFIVKPFANDRVLEAVKKVIG
jgi:two-component system chemotaxis response regulator CheY